MIIPFDEVKWMCPIVCKSGFSTLGGVYYKKKTGKQLDAKAGVWDSIMPILSKENNDFRRRFRENKSFVVYRDPVERFISLYTNMVSNEGSHKAYIIRAMGGDMDVEEARVQLFSDVGFFVEKGLELASKRGDEHVTKLVDCLSMGDFTGHHGVDVIVMLKDLDAFIKNELKEDLQGKHRNASRKKVDTSVFDPYREKIKEFYKDDYEFLKKNQHKVYDPSKPFKLTAWQKTARFLYWGYVRLRYHNQY